MREPEDGRCEMMCKGGKKGMGSAEKVNFSYDITTRPLNFNFVVWLI